MQSSDAVITDVGQHQLAEALHLTGDAVANLVSTKTSRRRRTPSRS